MPKIMSVYNVFLAHPGDTATEVERAYQAIDSVNKSLVEHGALLQLVSWDKDAFLSTNSSIQDSVDDQLLNTCDFAIAIFKHKLGSSKKGSKSGTAYEVSQLRKMKKHIIIFVCDPAQNKRLDEGQYELNQYIKKLKKEVPVFTYTSPDQLYEILLDQLQKVYAKDLANKQTVGLDIINEANITHLTRGKAPARLMQDHIADSKMVKIITTTGYSLFHNNTNAFTTMLKRGGELRLLVPRPGSEFLKNVEKDERREAGALDSELINVVQDIKNALSDSCGAGHVYIGNIQSNLRQTVILCVKEDDSIWAWITMTLPPTRAANESLSFGCEHKVGEIKKNTLAEMSNRHFNEAWTLAETANQIVRVDEFTTIDSLLWKKP